MRGEGGALFRNEKLVVRDFFGIFAHNYIWALCPFHYMMKHATVLRVVRMPFHILFATLLVAFVLAACEDDTSPSDVRWSTTPIAFSAAEGEGAFRGTAHGAEWATAPGSKMAVWAYYWEEGSKTPLGMMTENTLTYKEVNSTWDYSPVIYWPLTGSMDFFSYAPVCETARKEFTTFTPSHVDYQALLVNCHVPASEVTTINQLTNLAGLPDGGPNDAAHQEDLMFAFQRDVVCTDQSVLDHVDLHFAHVMAGLRLVVSGEHPIDIPDGTTKVVFGIGRLKTGGTLAICEPATPGVAPDVEWTLNGREGTFYITGTVEDDKVRMPADEFFFPPQTLDNGLRLTAYFYDSDGIRIDYREVTTSIKQLLRGNSVTLTVRGD